MTGAPFSQSARIAATPFVWRDPASISPREWLYGHDYIRKFVTATVSPGGIGKTSLGMVELLAMVTGKPLLGVAPFGGRPLRCWLYNLEDPRDELDRRIGAAMLHYGVTSADIGGRLFVDSGRDMPLKLAAPNERGGITINAGVVADIEADIAAKAIDVLSVDPFISSHAASENDNQAIDLLAKTWGGIADRLNISVAIWHHVRKTAPGVEVTVGDSRGASALVDAARVARVLNVMSDAEADQAGLSKETRARYFRCDHGKANLAPRSEAGTWYRFTSVDLGNATVSRPSDHVGVVERWELPGLFDQLAVDDLREIQKRIDKGAWRESVQSPQWAGFLVAQVLKLDATDKTDRARIKAMLRVWRQSGALVAKHLTCEDRKQRPCLVAGELV